MTPSSNNIFLSLDCEFNQPSQKIIQIGACIGDTTTGEILDTFSRLVQIDEPLCTDSKICDIPKLTGITEERLAQDGVSLLRAYDELVEFADKHPTRFLNPLTWGGGDSIELQNQVMAKGLKVKWLFGRRWLDVKTIFQARQFARQEKPQAGLARAMVKCGLTFKGRKHDALDDSINTFRIFHHLLKGETK